MIFQPLQTYHDGRANTTQRLFASAPNEKLHLYYIFTNRKGVSAIAEHVVAELVHAGRFVIVELNAIPPKDA
jgi:hypothetical protein